MSSYSEELINRMEQGLFEEIPPEVEHVHKGQAIHHDGLLVKDYTTTSELPIIGRAVMGAGTPIELKTCQKWIDDRGSSNKRRRGRWQVQKTAHEALEENDGAYCLLVLDIDEVLDGRLLPARGLNGLASWTNGGYKYNTPRAFIPWSKIIPK